MATKPAPKPAPVKKTVAAKPAPAAKPEAKAKAEKPAKEEKPKVERIVQNDVTRPKDGTDTGKVWAIADKLSNPAKGQYATRAEVMEVAVAEQLNEATVATQYQRWRVFNGVPKAAAPVKEAKPAKEPKAKPAPAAKAA